MKILVAGAGIGGLYAAYLFGKRGHAVTVYERANGPEEMRYDWHDDVNPEAFLSRGLKIPEGSFPKKDWTFISPCGNVLEMRQSEKNKDFSIERREINKYLCGLASEYADVVFDKTVSGAYVDEGRVAGLCFSDGKIEKCDLVIDCAGVDSVVRKSLPVTFGIDGEIEKEGVFCAYRAFYDAVEGEKAEYSNKVYMKHCGQNGISWCIVDDDSTKVDVLVGRMGKLGKEELTEALTELKKDNPVLGETIKRGGVVCRIPVRRPLDTFVADGYVALGDSACMTVPLIGSGIATSLAGASILYEVAGDLKSAPAEKLWEYEKRVYDAFGAEHCGVDYMKKWLLSRKNSDVDFLLGSGVLSNSDLQEVSVGRLIKPTFKEIVSKIRAVGLTRLHKLMPLAFMLMKTQRIVKIAKKIPSVYDEGKIAKWANALDKACG